MCVGTNESGENKTAVNILHDFRPLGVKVFSAFSDRSVGNPQIGLLNTGGIECAAESILEEAGLHCFTS
jgi:hypothetical protein